MEYDSMFFTLCEAYHAPGIALDYPPFFAYFEKLLSIPASFIDPKIVDLTNLNYDAWSVVAYQRTTVILTELVLGVALLR
jgi:alpha-1,3-glucosyltransferase